MLDKIKNSTYSKAKTILPDVIRAVRAEALKGISRNVTTSEKPLPRQAPRNESTIRSKANEIKPGESTRDFFMRD